MAGGHTLNIKQGPGPRSHSHPSRIRPGQMFFPRHGKERRRVMVKRLDGEWVRVLREDGIEVSLALDRLFARAEDGSGLHYRFHGWKPRPRGYRTELEVVEASLESGSCSLRLPEWDPDAEISELLATLPENMRSPGVMGSCMANLASPSAAGLGIHSCRKSKVRDASRNASGPHPEVLAEGQSFRRRRDQSRFRLLEVGDSKVLAWNGHRSVRLGAQRLLATRPDGEGLDYEYLSGGINATRRRRSKQR